MIVRNLVEIPNHDSFFIFGPRQTGKSTLIRKWLKGRSFFEVNLLMPAEYKKYSAEPDLLAQEAEYQLKHYKIKHIFIDEVQKVPALLDVVQSLIDKYKIQFILSGSSARKLKKMHVNLLGGRALVLRLFPLNYLELKENYKFERVLKLGSLAGVYLDSEKTAQGKLASYVETYLKEEVAQEGLVRNLAPFARFLDLAGQTTTQIVSFENISREAGVSAKSIASYYQILEDTLIGFFLPCWDRSVRKQLSKHPKFYFFDNGVTSCLNSTLNHELSSELRGAHFEQMMIHEIRSTASYLNAEIQFHFWRTLAGNEVDLILSRGGKPLAAIEFKNKKKLVRKDLSGLLSFSEEYPNVSFKFCVANVNSAYIQEGITCLGWEEFLSKHLLKVLK